MDRRFDDTDRNKSVMTSDGRHVGNVQDIDGDRVTVKPSDDHDEGLAEELKEMLGWGDDDDSYEVRREHVSSNDDDGIHLNARR